MAAPPRGVGCKGGVVDLIQFLHRVGTVGSHHLFDMLLCVLTNVLTGDRQPQNNKHRLAGEE